MRFTARFLLALTPTLVTLASAATEVEQSARCAGFSIESTSAVSVPVGLPEAMCAYYQAQEAEDWEATYDLRNAGFSKTVPFELYKRKMAERVPKIPLFKMLIRKVEYVRANEVHVVVDVQRMDAPGEREFSRQKGASSLGNRTEWEFEPDGWKCAACGEEPSFILNGRLVRYYDASDG